MPLDKNKALTANNPPTRPFVPTLASNRAVKSPITPRLAAQHLKATTTSPLLSAKSPRSDISTPRSLWSPVDDRSTAARSILSNVTPRSTSRKSRIDSAPNTPNGTPTTTPVTAKQTPAHDAVGSTKPNSSLGLLGGGSHQRPRSVVADNGKACPSPLLRPAAFAPSSRSGEMSPRDKDSNFFHASDAKTQAATAAIPAKKPSSFFFANGQKEDIQPARHPRAPSPTLSTITTRSQKSQFYRADGTLEDDNMPPLPSPRSFPNRSDAITSPHSLRPPSPQKADLHLTYRKGASQIIGANGLPGLTPSGPGSRSPKRRSITIEPVLDGLGRDHVRTVSLGSIDTSSSSRKSSLTALDINPRHIIHARGSHTSAPAGPRLPLPPTSNPLPLDGLNEALSRPPRSTPSQSRANSVSIPSLPQSPTQPAQQPPQNSYVEAAANARRERKVLDLEISNSSLLAINRQLEREVRRQKTELRRFRRLSRAGRLSSIGSLMQPIQQREGDLAEFSEDRMSNVSESEDELLDESDEDPDSSLSEDSIASSTLSPQALAQRDANRLAKDERRLQLDLTRHRQLLVDSHKMNQSLKRCMAWSEEMISEGRRALDYKVRVSDIKLGGRVLEHEELSVPPEDHDYDDGGPASAARRGLLGAWNPLDGATPVGLGNTDDERDLGLGLGIDAAAAGGERPAMVGGERDSGVHVDDDEFPVLPVKQGAADHADVPRSKVDPDLFHGESALFS